LRIALRDGHGVRRRHCRSRKRESTGPVESTSEGDVMDVLVRKACAFSGNPLRRRKLLHILVEEHEGYALPPSILDDADAVIELIQQRGDDQL
jgi:hypothetical protein